MLGLKSGASARAILGGIEMVLMMRKQQAKSACKQQLSLAEQFNLDVQSPHERVITICSFPVTTPGLRQNP
jgi:hypothetical protein